MADTSRMANWFGTLRLTISESKTFCIVTTFSVLFVDAVLLTAIGKYTNVSVTFDGFLSQNR